MFIPTTWLKLCKQFFHIMFQTHTSLHMLLTYSTVQADGQTIHIPVIEASLPVLLMDFHARCWHLNLFRSS